MSGTAGQVYLVTGGCGFLGKHLVRILAKCGEGVSEIRAFDLRPDREIETLSTGLAERNEQELFYQYKTDH